jgi:hypothetical protein
MRPSGLPTNRKYLFTIDGSKALRTALEEVFGHEQEVQRCLRNARCSSVGRSQRTLVLIARAVVTRAIVTLRLTRL